MLPRFSQFLKESAPLTDADQADIDLFIRILQEIQGTFDSSGQGGLPHLMYCEYDVIPIVPYFTSDLDTYVTAVDKTTVQTNFFYNHNINAETLGISFNNKIHIKRWPTVHHYLLKWRAGERYTSFDEVRSVCEIVFGKRFIHMDGTNIALVLKRNTGFPEDMAIYYNPYETKYSPDYNPAKSTYTDPFEQEGA